VSSFKFEVGEPMAEPSASSCFKLYTSNFRRVTGGTSCTNKPNWHRSDGGGKSFRDEELWVIGHVTDFDRTKPIPGGPGRDEAGGARDGAFRTNKANSRPCRVGRDLRDEGRVCETDPICPRGKGSVGQAPLQAGSIAPNKMPTTKVAEAGFDPLFQADIAGRLG